MRLEPRSVAQWRLLVGGEGNGPSCQFSELKVSAFLPCIPFSPPLPLSPFVTCRLQDKMKLIILDHYSQASEWAAKYIRNRIIQFNPGPDKYFTLGLPTGALWDGEGAMVWGWGVRVGVREFQGASRWAYSAKGLEGGL